MKILVDTNVLISAVIFGGHPRRLLLRLVQGGHELIVTEYIKDEFLGKIEEKWSEQSEHAKQIFDGMGFTLLDSSTNNSTAKLRDEKDIPVLSDAIFYGADVILSGDKDFLEAEIDKPAIYSVSMLDEFLDYYENIQETV